jgi:hypothetical protein
MANTVKKLARVAVTTSAVDVYTTPAATTTVVTNIVLTNTTGSALTATVKLSTIELLSSVSIPANGIFSLDLKQVLNTTETVNVIGSVAGLRIHVSGMEIA